MPRKVDAIRRALEGASLSSALRMGLRLATRVGAADFERWCRLELGGYLASNPALGDDVEVPAYRTVVGLHKDLSGRVLQLEPELSFINETRLRNGVEELEHLSASKETVSIHDAQTCDLIRQSLRVEVFSFSFSSVHLVGVLSAIRSELDSRLDAVDPAFTEDDVGEAEDVLMLRPNFYGIGIDLKAAWNRWKGK